jgi:hypothetical protein
MNKPSYHGQVTQEPGHGEKGQSFVEFALILIFFLILLAGVVDLGRIFMVYLAMRDAAEEGIIYGIINPEHCHQIEDRIRENVANPENLAVSILVDGTDCYDATPRAQACIGHEIEVLVTDPNFTITMPFMGTVVGSQQITLNARANGMILRPACADSS